MLSVNVIITFAGLELLKNNVNITEKCVVYLR